MSSWASAPSLVPEDQIDHQRWAWMLEHMDHSIMAEYLPPGWRPRLPGGFPKAEAPVKLSPRTEGHLTLYPILLTPQYLMKATRSAIGRCEKKALVGVPDELIGTHKLSPTEANVMGTMGEFSAGIPFGVEPDLSTSASGDGGWKDLVILGDLRVSVKTRPPKSDLYLPAHHVSRIRDDILLLVESTENSLLFWLVGWTPREIFLESHTVQGYPWKVPTAVFPRSMLSPMDDLFALL